jgi:hypothetical protein
MVRKEGEHLGSGVVAQHSAAGIEGFREAVREGLLEVHTFGQTSVEAHFRGGGDRLRHANIADVLAAFVKLVEGAVGNGKRYSLLDAHRRPALGRLPLFEPATVR